MTASLCVGANQLNVYETHPQKYQHILKKSSFSCYIAQLYCKIIIYERQFQCSVAYD